MIAPMREFVRQRAIASYQEIESLSFDALDREIDRALSEPEWTEIMSSDMSEPERLDAAKDYLRRCFYFEPDDGPSDVPRLIDELRLRVGDKHESNCG
ncbi:hypothetical protein ACCT20_37015, partial [Rhizobium ruizarguesonis]